MNIDVDIQGELLPNWFTILVQLLSTAVLVFFFYKFLWKPVRKYLADKSALTQKPLEDALEKERQAELANNEAKEKLAAAAKKSESLVESGRKEGEKIKNDLVNEGQEKVRQMMENATAQIASDREKMEEEVKSDMVDVALLAAGKLAIEKSDEEGNRKMIEGFLKDLEDGQ